MKKIAVLLICSLLIVQVCGCSARTERVISEPSVSITYSWWGNDDRNAYTLEGIDAFENEQNGRVDVECKYSSWSGYENRMHIFMKSKNTPDVMLINYSWLDEYSADGTGFYDLYEVSDRVKLDNYTEDELAFGVKNGKLNAVPISFNTSIFYFNKTIYDKYHLNIPTTWDELFHAAEVMGSDDVYPLGVTEKQAFLLVVAYYVQTTGKDLTDASGNLTVTREDIEAMLDFYARLINEKVIMPVDSFTRNSFSTGAAAGTLAWISDGGNYCEPAADAGYEVVIGDYICEPDAKKFGWYVKPATMYAISATTEHPEEAAELLNYLLNSREMTILQDTEKGIPISDAARKVLDEEGRLVGYEKLADDKREQNADRLEILPPIYEKENIYDSFKTNADYYLYGKKSKEEVVDTIVQSFHK